MGNFTEDEEQTECEECPENHFTANTGSTSVLQCITESKNIPDKHPRSSLTSNISTACVVVQPNSPCLSSPCGDNGLCVYTSSGGFECICANDYTGSRCDVSPDPCDVNGCLNGGTCQAREDAFNYTCACDDGWTGFFCEHRIGNTLLPPLSALSPFHLFYGCSKTVLNSYFYQ